MNPVFPEWLNANSVRSFPLSENGSRRSLPGGVVLPNSLIVAAQINMLPAYAVGVFFVRSVVATPSRVVISIGYSEGVEQRSVASIHIPVSSHKENTTYPFVGTGQDSSILGSLTIGDITETLASVPGEIFFEKEATAFEVSALFVSSPALEAIEVYSGSVLVKRFDRVLKLRAGENIRITLVDDDPDTIRLDAIQGENLVSPDDCENAPPIPPCIRTINNQPPDENGNFDIDGSKCIDAVTSPGLIVLKDLCSQSCCGCNELSELVAGLQGVEAQIAQLNNQMNVSVVQQSLMLSNIVSNLQ
jgi:hypothetical protein